MAVLGGEKHEIAANGARFMANAGRFAVKREAVMETGGRFTVTRTAVTANRDRFTVNQRGLWRSPGPAPGSSAAYQGQPDFNPLIEQPSVRNPEKFMSNPNQAHFAIGLIETQGFAAVFEAVDTALKTASVEVLAREKLGGGYITVVIKGDVAAVRAAIDAAKVKVEGLGRLIAAHVIPSPSQGVLSLLPK